MLFCMEGINRCFVVPRYEPSLVVSPAVSSALVTSAAGGILQLLTCTRLVSDLSGLRGRYYDCLGRQFAILTFHTTR
jgi:hypothetical protein